MILATTTKQALVDIRRGVVLTIPGQRVCGTLRERLRDIPREYPTKLITAGQQLELVLKTTVERAHVAGDEDVRRKREREAVVLAGGKNDGKYGRRRRCEEGSWREDEEGARRVRGRCEGHWKRMGINTLVPTQAGNSGRCSEDVCTGACRQRYPKATGISKLQGHREPAAAAVWALASDEDRGPAQTQTQTPPTGLDRNLAHHPCPKTCHSSRRGLPGVEGSVLVLNGAKGSHDEKRLPRRQH